jgi:hypothetical protein
MQSDSSISEDVLYFPIARHTVIAPARKMKFFSSGLWIFRIAPYRAAVTPAAMLDGESEKGKEWRCQGAGRGSRKAVRVLV